MIRLQPRTGWKAKSCYPARVIAAGRSRQAIVGKTGYRQRRLSAKASGRLYLPGQLWCCPPPQREPLARVAIIVELRACSEAGTKT